MTDDQLRNPHNVEASDFIAWDSHDDLLVGASWRVKCARCGTIVTKYDFTREEALELAQTHLKECPKRA